MKFAFLPYYGRDFIADTTRLSRTLKSAYLDLMWYMWERADLNTPPQLTDDAEVITSLLGCTDEEWDEWRAILTRGKSAAFITVSDGTLTQKRLTEEWQKATEVYEAKATAGRKGANARWGNNTAITKDSTAIADACDRIATAIPTDSRPMANDGQEQEQEQEQEQKGCNVLKCDGAVETPNAELPDFPVCHNLFDVKKNAASTKFKMWFETNCPNLPDRRAVVTEYLATAQSNAGPRADFMASLIAFCCRKQSDAARWAKADAIKNGTTTKRSAVMDDLSCGGKAEVFGGPRLD